MGYTPTRSYRLLISRGLNADEGEPGTFKDRYFLKEDPFLLLEGCILTCYAIKSNTCYIYTRGEFHAEIEIIDRAIETGVLLPAPRRGACTWCDFRVVCGPWEEIRVLRKDETKLVDLQVLRRLP